MNQKKFQIDVYCTNFFCSISKNIFKSQQWNKSYHSNDENMKLLQTYFKQLTDMEILQLQKLYKVDIDIFGYSDPTNELISDMTIEIQKPEQLTLDKTRLRSDMHA